MKYLLQGETTARILFREIEDTDYPYWLPFFENPNTAEHWVADYDTPEKECKKWYKRQKKRYDLDEGGMNVLIAKESGALIGHCGLLLQDVDGHEELEIGYSLLPQFWNKGYATEAALRCRDVAFEKRYAPSLISIISLSNIPSQQVALKNGMKKDVRTTYRNNPVHIFRITHSQWSEL